MRKALVKGPVRALSGISESCYSSASSRKMLKLFFAQREKDQTLSQLQDLERTIAINKEIINNLIEGSNQEETHKDVLKALNEENANLRRRFRLITEERNSFQSKLLIAEQIIEDYKGKEQTFEEQLKEKTSELLDQLNMKEYVLQSYERKYNTILDAVKKYAADTTIRKILAKLNVDIDKEKRITNVVEENALLLAEIQTARERVNELEAKLSELAKSKEANSSTKETSVSRKSSFNNTLSESAQLTKLREQMKELTDENEAGRKALEELQEKNERLSLSLAGAKKEVRALKTETFRMMMDERREIAAIRDDNAAGTESDCTVEHSVDRDDIIDFMCDG